jgi:hypothetical protein
MYHTDVWTGRTKSPASSRTAGFVWKIIDLLYADSSSPLVVCDVNHLVDFSFAPRHARHDERSCVGAIKLRATLLWEALNYFFVATT